MILFWYITRHLMTSTAAIAFGITTLVWLSQSLRFLKIVTTKHVGFIDFFFFTSLLLPDLLGLSLPLSFFIAVLWVYRKMALDRELSIFKTSGLSDFGLLKPVLSVASGLVVCLFLLNLWILPLAFRHFRMLELYFRHHYTGYMVRSGEFNTLGPVVIYAQKRYPKGRLQGIFIYDTHNPQKPVVITSEHGAIQETEEGLQLILTRGNRRELVLKHPHASSSLSFDRYSVSLSPQTTVDRPLKPHEMYISELLSPPPYLSPLEKEKRRQEGLQRLIVPFYSLFLGLLAALFCIRLGSFSRESWSFGVWSLVSMSLSFEGALLFLLNSSKMSLSLFCLTLFFMVLPGLIWLYLWRKDQAEEESFLIPQKLLVHDRSKPSYGRKTA